jgi:4'-phosphopantetheinyl transferase EntD
MASLVPESAAVAETFDVRAAQALLDDEQALIAPAPESRRLDLALGRACARQALQKLGVAAVPILRGSDGEPLWPPEVCGSITHCAGYCAAVAAHKRDLASIGIDAEPAQDLGEVVLDQVAVASERDWIKRADRGMPWPLLLFSAKESVFKAWFPLFGTALSFKHVVIDFDPAKAAFTAVVCREPGMLRNAEFVGRFGLDGRYVLTIAFTPAARLTQGGGGECLTVGGLSFRARC